MLTRRPTSKISITLALAAALIMLGTAPALGQTPTITIGGELQVNSYTTGNQWFPASAMLEDGSFVIVWQSGGSDNGDDDGSSVQGRRYSSGGEPLASTFLVNAYTTGAQEDPAITAVPDGGFIVVWESAGSDGDDTSDRSIQAQRFDSSGNGIATPFQVNDYTTNAQVDPRVAADDDGGFVVVWASSGSDGGDTSNESIQGQRFASDGTALGTQFQVNDYTSSEQDQASVAMAGDGSFLVVWRSLGSDNGDDSGRTVQAQRFDSAGSPIAGQFLVNSYTDGSQLEPDVGVAADGTFVVAWESNGSNGSDSAFYSVQAQRFSADGNAVGDQIQVNTYTTSSQRGPSIGVDQGGDFVVTWRSYGSDNGDVSRNSVRLRHPRAAVRLGGRADRQSVSSQ